MRKNVTFKITVTDDDDGDKVLSEVKLPYDIVMQVVANLPDVTSLSHFYKVAVEHPAPIVREYLAAKDKINEEIFNILAKDESITVLRSLCRSSPIKKFADLDLLKKLIQMGSECAHSIANNYHEFEQIDPEELLTILLASPDPSIRYALVNNWSIPKKVARSLVNDRDPQVANEALSRLEN